MVDKSWTKDHGSMMWISFQCHDYFMDKGSQFIKIGKLKLAKKAEEIKNLSSVRGTAMHKYLESYI